MEALSNGVGGIKEVKVAMVSGQSVKSNLNMNQEHTVCVPRGSESQGRETAEPHMPEVEVESK